MITPRPTKNFIVPERIESAKPYGTKVIKTARPPSIPAINDTTVATCAGIENRLAVTLIDENSTTNAAFF